jgi:ribosomal protein S6--L-glutamate ligase
VRVIIAGDYVEAYSRFNPDSFRNNLSVGGSCRSYNLDADAERFCREIMRQGRFPYAHVDLHLTETGDHFLSEIALNGGIKGAKITRNELNRKKEAVIEQLVQEEVN